MDTLLSTNADEHGNVLVSAAVTMLPSRMLCRRNFKWLLLVAAVWCFGIVYYVSVKGADPPQVSPRRGPARSNAAWRSAASGDSVRALSYIQSSAPSARGGLLPPQPDRRRGGSHPTDGDHVTRG